jgi:septal ring factor EnvC (AmiA/AmiB activator)
VQGGGGGAALGALIGGVVGGRGGAALGALIGSLGGLVVAEVVNTKRRDYADNASRLEAEQRIAAKNLANTRRYNGELAGRVNALDQQAALLQRERDFGRTDLAAAARVRNQMEEETQAARGNLAKVDEALAESRRQRDLAARAPEDGRHKDVAALSQQIQALEAERARLVGSIDRLSASMRRI